MAVTGAVNFCSQKQVVAKRQHSDHDASKRAYWSCPVLLVLVVVPISYLSGCYHLRSFRCWARLHCCEVHGMGYNLTGSSHGHYLTGRCLANWMIVARPSVCVTAVCLHTHCGTPSDVKVGWAGLLSTYRLVQPVQCRGH